MQRKKKEGKEQIIYMRSIVRSSFKAPNRQGVQNPEREIEETFSPEPSKSSPLFRCREGTE